MGQDVFLGMGPSFQNAKLENSFIESTYNLYVIIFCYLITFLSTTTVQMTLSLERKHVTHYPYQIAACFLSRKIITRT